MHTILIPVFNGAQYIEETIRNIIEQKDISLTIVISDNCSTDETQEIINKIIPGHPIEYYRQKTNIGMFSNFNFLLSKVKTETFSIISHDDKFSSEHALFEALQVLKENPGVGVVFSDMEYINAKGNVISQRRFWRSGLFDPTQVARQSIISTRNLFGIPLAIRSQAIKFNISFDENITYAADLDFAIMCGKMGLSYYQLPKILVQYRVHGTNGTVGLQRRALGDLRFIAEKHNIKLGKILKAKQLLMFYINMIGRTILLRVSA